MHLKYSLEVLFYQTEDFRSSVSSLGKLYEASQIVNVMRDGTHSYPRLTEKEDLNGSNGMSFELK